MYGSFKRSQSSKEISKNQNEYDDRGEKESLIPVYDPEYRASKYRPIGHFKDLRVGFSIKEITHFKRKNNEMLQSNNHLRNILERCLQPTTLQNRMLLRNSSTQSIKRVELPKLLNEIMPNKTLQDPKTLKKSASAAELPPKPKFKFGRKRKIVIKGALCRTSPAERDVESFPSDIKAYFGEFLKKISNRKRGNIQENKELIQKEILEKLNSDCHFLRLNYDSRVLGKISVFGIVDGEGEYGFLISQAIKNYILKFFKNSLFPTTKAKDNFFTILTTLFEQCNKFLKECSYIPLEYDKVKAEIMEEDKKEKEKKEREEQLRKELEQMEKAEKEKREKEKREREIKEKMLRDKELRERTKKEQELKQRKLRKAITSNLGELPQSKLSSSGNLRASLGNNLRASLGTTSLNDQINQNLVNINTPKKEENKENPILEENEDDMENELDNQFNLTRKTKIGSPDEKDKSKEGFEDNTNKDQQQLNSELKETLLKAQLNLQQHKNEEIVYDQKIDDLPQFQNPIPINCYDSGASAILLLIPNDIDCNKIYCASVGTCKAVLYTMDKSFPLTYVHTSNCPSEVERIRKTEKGEIRNKDDFKNVTTPITNTLSNTSSAYISQNNPPNIFYPFREHKRGLNLTRCFGYFYWERMGIKADAVISDRDLLKINYKFLVVGSNGFWKFFDNDEVRLICLKFYNECNFFAACKELESIARKRKSATRRNGVEDDDITVMVIFFTVEVTN